MSLGELLATSACGHQDDLEVVMVGFADLGEVMAARSGNDSQVESAPALVPVAGSQSTPGHWACYLWQTSRGSWQDVADALDMSFGTTYRRAKDYCWAQDLPWPLEKRVEARRVVREVIRGVT